MENLKCNHCGAGRETTDNFCRRCGHQFTVNLPSVRSSSLPARTGASLPPSLVGSVAVLALGTGLEWLARRMAGSAARAAGRALVNSDRPPAPAVAPAEPDDITVQEVLYVRKVHLRR